MGSVALGSGLIAITSILRFIYDITYKNLEELSKNNKIYNTMIKVVCCCCWVFEKILLMITKYVYVSINLSGDGFCSSGSRVIDIINRDTFTFALVGGLGELFTMIGRLFISTLVSSICLYYLSYLLIPYVPTVICLGISFSISSVFMSVYGISAEAIYMTYIYDD